MTTNNIDLNTINAARIIAALPGLLGYIPTESFIIIVTAKDNNGTNIVRCTLRADITAAAEKIANLPKLAAQAFRGADAAILIALGGQWNDAHTHTILDTLRDAIAAEGIQIAGRLIARDTTTPGQWHNIDTNETGTHSPYTDSTIIAIPGGTIAADRETIVREFTPTTNRAPICTQPLTTVLIETFEEVAHIVAGDRAPSTDLATRAGIIITASTDLRDTMLLLSAEHPRASAQLWTTLANELTGGRRVEALTIAATLHYIASDTIRAGIALDIAENEAEHAQIPLPRLAQLLALDLTRGISPTQVLDNLLSLISTRTTE